MRDTLLIVDDMEINRTILRTLFESEYNLLEAENGEQALLLIRQYHASLAAILLDLLMPVKNGYQVMEELSHNGLMSNIPIIVITAQDSSENEIRALDLGAADIIIKPFKPHVVRRRVQNAVELTRYKIHLEEMVEEQAEKLRASQDTLLDTLSSIIEHRSMETGQHVLRIRMFTKLLLENVMHCWPEYELDERTVGVISEAAALHDIGKISIPDTILNKPARLTAEEFEIMKGHTVKGCEILAGLNRMGNEAYLTYAYNICRYHHERWDGSGYPDSLKGDNVPICAQAVGVADAYDALTTDRVYRKAIPPEQAVTMILNGECGAFSPKLLECLKTVRSQFFALTRQYADGLSPKEDVIKRPVHRPVRAAEMERTAEMGQLKYLAMLRYSASTVMELDADSGVYHLVYQQNEDFQDLRSGGTFEQALRTFAERSVHPDDRAIVLNIPDKYAVEFFSSGLMRRSRTYRILHRATGEYIWYEASAIRVDLENPRHRKVLIIWKQLEPQVREDLRTPCADSAMPVAQNLLVGIQQCRSDAQFTITYVNDGLLNLLGYTRQEIQDLFHDRYLEMIYPADRLSVRRRFLEQLSSGKAGKLEYRVLAKNRPPVWVLDQWQLISDAEGMDYCNCVLTDITQVKQVQEELRLHMEQYRIILDQTNDIIFEWDLQEDRITYSSNWEKKFGYQPASSGAQIQTASHLFPADVPILMNLIQDVSSGMPYREVEVRIADRDGKYIWCRIRATTQFDDGRKPIKAVGVILDIDLEMRRTQELIHQAEQDSLTNLYTKNTACDIIRRALEQREPEARFALMIIDLDNFKQINDSFGHMFGDAVLAEAAAQLKRLFRTGDVVARFGGDEFLVFLQHTADRPFLECKAQCILETFFNVFPGQLKHCRLTCSVGISRCPEDGLDFQDLFQRCDQALYQAKHAGKNRFAFYDGTIVPRVFGLDSRHVFASGTGIDSENEADCSVDHLVPQAFKLLYESGDLEAAVNAILEMAGRICNVSRVYIFEDSADGTWSKNTFEWCNDGIQPAIHDLQHVTYQELGPNYRANFDEHGIFFCRDISILPREQYEILAAQGIRSLLQCAVRDGGKFVGFVGFDDCIILRMWTQNQIDALTFISELLSTFLLKKRAQDRAVAAAENLRMALDNQNSWIYVIDPDSYSLLYLNAKTLRTVPEARLDMPCYQAFFHRDSPCEKCPAKDIRTIRNQTMEIWNPILSVATLADASLIHWGGTDACLMTCHDITNYVSTEETDTPKL